MRSIARRHWPVGVGLVFGLVLLGQVFLSPIPTGQAAPLRQPVCDQTGVAGTELNLDQRNNLFQTVPFQPTGVYPPGGANPYLLGELRDGWDLDYNHILPVLLKAIAGIESDWLQFGGAGNTTTRGSTSCDWGIMQINEGKPELFSKSPSLMGTTDGNIAAAAQELAELWRKGLSTNSNALPVVNDYDPHYLLDWYYVISSYNGGPSLDWKNNPNCGVRRVNFSCGDQDFRLSRGVTRSSQVDWFQVSRGNYPYQERVLYNLQYPKYPNIRPWDVEDLLLKRTTTLDDYGIRPDDTLFLGPGEASTAPNLLLFEHFATELTSFSKDTGFTLAYDLPLQATVSIAIYEMGTTGNEVAGTRRNLFSASQNAGWHQRFLALPTTINANYVYEITAQRGSGAGAYIGRYTQKLRLQGGIPAALPPRAFLPVLVLPSGAFSQPLLWNGNLQPSERRAITGWPRYWQLQGIVASDRPAGDLVTYTSSSGVLSLRGTPYGRVDFYQRLSVSTAQCYTLRFVSSRTISFDESTSQLAVRLRQLTRSGENSAAPAFGRPWHTADTITGPGSTMDETYTYQLFLEAGDYTLSFLAVFPADGSSASQFRLSRISIDPAVGSCVNPFTGVLVVGTKPADAPLAAISNATPTSNPYPPPAPTRTPRPNVTATPSVTPVRSPTPTRTPTRTVTRTATANPYPPPATATRTPPRTATRTP